MGSWSTLPSPSHRQTCFARQYYAWHLETADDIQAGAGMREPPSPAGGKQLSMEDPWPVPSSICWSKRNAICEINVQLAISRYDLVRPCMTRACNRFLLQIVFTSCPKAAFAVWLPVPKAQKEGTPKPKPSTPEPSKALSPSSVTQLSCSAGHGPPLLPLSYQPGGYAGDPSAQQRSVV